MLCTCALLPLFCSAATDKPVRVKNDGYGFAFTVEANCEITYQKGGVGFSAVHIPPGAGDNDPGDYGLLVYGSPRLRLTPKEAKAAGYEEKETLLAPADLGSQDKLQAVFAKTMELRGHKPGGEASVRLPDGKTLKVNYFHWNEQRAGRSAYALMYIVMHEDGLIYVQAESARKFSEARIKHFTTQLERLKPES
jgi:hypothetical protein